MSWTQGWARFAASSLLASLSVASLAGQAHVSLRTYVGRSTNAIVTSVIDGDTVHARLGEGVDIVVRLDGIDAPERGEPFSVQARNAARVLLYQKPVAIRGTDVDRYGRLVARVSSGGIDSSKELLRAGLACHFVHYSSDAALAEAQTDARVNGRGFWKFGAEQPRCVRTSGLSAPVTASARLAGPFHGNIQSHVYHAASCRNYNCKNCTQVFVSSEDAARAGFTPAGDCVGRR